MFLVALRIFKMNNFIAYLKSHFFAVLVLTLLLIFIPVALYLQFGSRNLPSQSQTPIINPHPAPILSDFNQSYGNFNQLSPGKSDLKAVEKINGPAISSAKNGNKTYLYYQTPSADYKNIVMLKNGILYYSLENVFGEYRGNYSDYVASYGQPALHLYNKDSSSSEWYIFLKQGLGVEVSSNKVLRVLYFVPQSKTDFLRGLTLELNLTNVSQIDQPPMEPFGINPAL
jgi:hypothetical protein